MSQSIALSDELVREASLTAAAAARTTADQIEHWAQLGRTVEILLQGSQAAPLRRAGEAQTLGQCLESVDTEAGQLRVAQYLAAQPFPHYESAPDRPGWLIRIDADGSRSLGRFVNRQFQVSE